MSVDVLVADPPWRFGDKLPGNGRGAEKHYPCMSIDALCSFELPKLGVDAVLFMWRVSSMPEEALRLVRAWGFVPKTELVWEKLTRTGKAHFGMGRILRASHETCIVATRGKVRPAVLDVRTRFAAPVREHSQKPEEFYAIVERLFPESRKFELFARTVRPGWEQQGNELGKLGSVEAASCP